MSELNKPAMPFDWAAYCEMLYQTLAQIGDSNATG